MIFESSSLLWKFDLHQAHLTSYGDWRRRKVCRAWTLIIHTHLRAWMILRIAMGNQIENFAPTCSSNSSGLSIWSTVFYFYHWNKKVCSFQEWSFGQLKATKPITVRWYRSTNPRVLVQNSAVSPVWSLPKLLSHVAERTRYRIRYGNSACILVPIWVISFYWL